MLRKKFFLSFICALSLTTNGMAQDPANTIIHTQDLGQTITFASSEMSFDAKIVKDAPFSADIITEFTQVLQDGNRIERISKGNLYRDSQGRTRREHEHKFPFGKKMNNESGEAPRSISIYDPVSGNSYFMNTGDKAFGKAFSFGSGPSSSISMISGSGPSGGGPAIGITSRRDFPRKKSISSQMRPLKRLQPVYPEAAKAAGAEGGVELKVIVSGEGKVIEANAISGHPLLRDAAVEAAKQWEYPVLSDKSAKREVHMTFVFTRDDEENKFITGGPLPTSIGITEGIRGAVTMVTPAIPAPPFPPMAVESTEAAFGPDVLTFTGAERKKEALGTQIIEGIEAEGTRYTQTVPAGVMGNVNPIEIVSERWYSPKLQTTIMSKTVDPRIGTTIFRLTNITQGEPDPSLFKLPEEVTKPKE